MSYENAAWIVYALFICGFAAWFVWHVVTTFGWEGVAMKLALLWDGLVVAGMLISLKIPFTHWAIAKPHDGPARWLYFAMAELVFGGYFYTVLSNRPTRWLLHRPRIKWPLYIAALLIFARVGIKEGWL